ncbi:hypothetical protein AAFF39_03790 [Lactococcus garvieae]
MKIKRDLFKEIYEKHGIQTTAAFHCDLNQEMTDEQYQKNWKHGKSFRKWIGMIWKMMSLMIFRRDWTV